MSRSNGTGGEEQLIVRRRQGDAREKDLLAQGRFSEVYQIFKPGVEKDMPEALQRMMHLTANSVASGVGRFVSLAHSSSTS